MDLLAIEKEQLRDAWRNKVPKKIISMSAVKFIKRSPVPKYIEIAVDAARTSPFPVAADAVDVLLPSLRIGEFEANGSCLSRNE